MVEKVRKLSKMQGLVSARKRIKTDEGSECTKRKRFLWSEELHKQFLIAIFRAGIRNASVQNINERVVNSSSDISVKMVDDKLKELQQNENKFIQQFSQTLNQSMKKVTKDKNKTGLPKSSKSIFHVYPFSSSKAV